MAEPSSSGLLAGIGVGVSTGLTYAVAAVQANPEIATAMTPPLNESLGLLALAAVGAVIKSYIPSEKKVDGQFEELKAQHAAFAVALADAAKDAKEAAEESKRFRIELSGWMGSVDAKLEGMQRRQDHFEDRKAS